MRRLWAMFAATLFTAATANAAQGPLPDTGSGITRDIGSIAVIEHDGSDYSSSPAAPNYGPRIAVTKRFYQTHGDYYDFLVIFTNFEFATGGATAFHSLVSNNVTGIGKPLSQGAADFGSGGRLKGVVDMAALTRYKDPNGELSLRPGDPRFTLALNVLAHEVGHQWLASALYRDSDGNNSNGLLGRDGSHWNYLLDSDASTLYGSDWVATAPGRYRAERVMAGYSALDLYLMGLLDKSKVPAFTLLRAPGVDGSALPVEGAEVEATPETITIDQVISAMGPRSPDSANSQKEFRLGFVFLTAPGTQPSDDDLASVEAIRQFFAAHFFGLTRGVAIADTSLTDRPSGSSLATPDLGLAKAWLLGRQEANGRFEDSPSTTIRDTAAAVAVLASLDEQPLATSRALAWLDATSPGNADFKARQVLALAPSVDASRRARFRADLLKYGADSGGFGLFPGFVADPIDTALALQALRVSDAPANGTIDAAFQALASSRLAGGGWPSVAASEASVASTAEVLLAIRSWEDAGRGAGLKASALSGLLALQNADGGFGENGASTAYATASALVALTSAAAPIEVLGPAIAWLHTHQLEDGSWNGSVYETARVLAALFGGARPNLVVAPGGFSMEPEAPEEGDAAIVRATVRNVGRTLAGATRAALYDGPPGANTLVAIVDVPEIAPDEQFVAEFVFPTADRPGPRDLSVVADFEKTIDEVREDDNVAPFSVTVRGLQADLEIRPDGISIVPEPLAAGEVAQVRVLVVNKGQRQAPPSVLLVTDGDPAMGADLIGQVSIPTLAPGASITLEATWTPEEAGVYEIHATSDASYQVSELDERNNGAARLIEVLSEIPVQADLTLEGARFDPEVLERIPSVAAYHVLAANLGQTAAATTVRLFDASAPGVAIAEQSVSLAGRSRQSLVLDVPVVGSGSRVVVARIDPDGLVVEANELNNDASAALTDSRGTVDLLISGAAASPTTVVIGRDVTVSASLKNEGTANAASVPVVLLAPGGAELARVTVSVGAGSVLPVTITWKSTLPGEPLPLVIRADPFNNLAELSEDNNEGSVELSVTPAPETNLAVQSGGIAFNPNPLVEGQTAQLSATVMNTTAIAAGPFTVRFYRGDPLSGGQLIGEEAIPGVAPGSSVVSAVVWPVVAAQGATGIFVVVDADDTVTEYDEADNRAFRSFVALGYPDIALSAASVTLEPRFPRSGQSVQVRVTVTNVGGQPSSATALRLTEGEGAAAVAVATLALEPLMVGEARAVEFAWTPAAVGERLLTVLADADGVLVEADEGNNTARLTVLVQDADFWLSEAFFSPDGDGKRDTTTLAYRAGSPVSIDVLDSEGRVVRTLAQSAPMEGTLTWDGRRNTGVIAPDGPYVFSVRTGDGAFVGSASAVLDTNREDLFGAAGTAMLAQRDVTCAIPAYLFSFLGEPIWTKAEDARLYIQGNNSEFETGIVRVGLDGTYDYLLKGDGYEGKAFASDVSPDGREVAIRDGSYQIEILDLITGARRPLDLFAVRVNWSPDGSMLIAGKRLLTRSGELVTELPTPDLDYFNESSWVWSPDGRFLANGTSVVNRDGSGYRTIGDLVGGETIISSTIVRNDGSVVTQIQYGCSDGCAGARTLVVDPDTDQITELEWLAVERGVGDATAQKWSLSSREVLFTTSATFVADESGGNSRPLSPEYLYSVSPNGTAGLFSKARTPGVCASEYGQFALTTLNNLAVSLDANRLPGNRGVALQATVGDRNLASYQLDYADASAPSEALQWRPIGPAYDSPVNDELLTVWVPPAPGTYAVRLSAEDRAGNTRSSTQLISWERTPVIANLTQSARLISPTGDGIRDDVTFAYLVLEPTVVEVRVNGPRAVDGSTGPLMRSFALSHPAIGPASFIWDGRDELGVLVPDGVFTVSIADLPFSVKVDSTPPDIAWSHGPLLYSEGDLRTSISRHIVDENLKGWLFNGWSTNPVFVPALGADGSPIFGPNGAPAVTRGPDGRALDVVKVEKVEKAQRGVAAVLTASDQAGNVSSLTVAPVPRGLFVLAACEADANLEEGKCKLERTYPNNKGSVKLPLRTYFRLVETSGDGRDGPVRFEHRLRGTTTWIQTAPAFSLKLRDVRPRVKRFSEEPVQNFWPVDLEALGITLGVEYEGRFVREGGDDGESLTTDIFAFSACNPYLETVLTPIDPDPQGQTLKFDVRLAGDIGEPVANASLTVVARETVLVDQPFDVRSTVRIVLPTGLCDATFSVTLRGNSGREYKNMAPCQALRKTVNLGCPPPDGVLLAQTFAFCNAKPDDVHFIGYGSTYEFEMANPPFVPIPVSRGPLPRTYIWDVTDRPEGTEALRAGIRGANGALQDPQSVDTVIDRTPPGVFVLDPALEGDLVCPTTLEDGRRAATFEFEADDLGGQAEVCSAEVKALSGPFAGMTNPVAPLCTAAGGKVVVCGSQGAPQYLRVATNAPAALTTSIEGLSSGAYGLSLTVADRAGNRTLATRRFSILGSGIGVDTPNPAIFSPNGDGLLDQTAVRVRVAQTATVSASVESIRDLIAGQLVAAGSAIDVPWDGRRADGSVVPDGKYTIVVTSRDACNSVSTKKVIVEVDNTPPTVFIAAPAEGSPVSVSTTVRGHADDLNFSTYQLLTKPAGLTEFVGIAPPQSGAIRTGAAGLLGNWPLPATPGVHLLRLIALDRAQNRSETTVSVNVGTPGALLRLSVTPDLFSPNGDGRRESATVSYSLSAARRVTLEILNNAGGGLVRTLQSSLDAETGDHAIVWDGRNGIGEVVPDGEYAVRLTATDPIAANPTEIQETSLRVDATPPVIQVTSPLAQAVVSSESEVNGSIEDPLLKEYSLRAFSSLAGNSAQLARGSTAISGGVLASLAQLADGNYSLFVTAEDAAENQSLHERPFVVDTTPPEVLFANPPPDAVLPKTTTPVQILGTASDLNLVDFRLEFGRGPNPTLFTPITTGPASVFNNQLGLWNVASLPDGVYTLRLIARDRAGLETESRRMVTLDGTPPVALILVPQSGTRTNGRTPIQGTASDQNFESWTLEGAPGALGPASQWTELARGADAVVASLLSEWTLLPADGVHSFRLTARDRAGHASTATTTIELDTHPPRPPVPIRIDIEGRQASSADLRVVWSPSPDTDVSGYFIYREDGTKLNDEPQSSLSYLDLAQAEGLRKYMLSAVDFASNESERVSISRQLDLSPPTVAITAPADGAVVSGDLAIHGIAFSPTDFKEYRLFVEPAGNPAQRVLIRRSTLPVSNASIGRWLAVGNGNYLLTLQAEDLAGNQAETTSTLTVDATPPQAVTLTSLQISPLPDSLTALWTPSSSADILGYLLYRNGRLANVDTLVLGDLRPYALTDLTYVNNGLPDGRHCYNVVAMDAAGNRSPPSNQLCADLDNRPPHAAISTPAPGHRFDSPLLVAATSPDTDIATVALQYRPSGTPSWLALGGPDSQAPYEATLQIAGLTEGPYDLRGVATDTGGRTDPNPEFITVQFTDVTPPPAPLALSVAVDGSLARLTWNAAPTAVHYRLYRDGEAMTLDPVTGLTFDDADRPEGQYQYAVTASDDHDNESPRSNPAIATIYAPALSRPPFPVLESDAIDLLVSGVIADGTLELSRNEIPMPPSSVVAGETLFPGAPLVAGPNIFKVRAVHQNGDRSLWSEESVFIRNEPPSAVQGLQASAAGFSALVQWDPVVDPELIGYEVSRDGETRSTLEPITQASEITGTDVPFSNGFRNGAEFSFDQDHGTVWIPGTDSQDPFVTLTLAQPVMISRVSLQFVKADEFYYLGPGVVADYRIDVRWDGRFLPALTVRGNQAEGVEHEFPAPFLTDTVRVVLLGHARRTPTGISEIGLGVVRYSPVAPTSLQDTGLSDGRYAYSVSAVDRYGAVGPAGLAEVAIGDVQPPAPPLNLTATLVGSDVRLDWVDGDPGDTDHYVLKRDGTVIAQTAASSPTHLDVQPLNGVYEYVVHAVDAVGNRSVDSNTAFATIQEPVLDAPVLTGGPGPLGESVLSWTHDGAPAFELRRALSESGPFTPVTLTPSLEYRDLTVPPGATAWYVVRAIDQRGNPSPDSNVVSITPGRSEPPAPPVILEPTDAYNPISVGVSWTPVGGRAEPGASVRVFVDGRLSGIAPVEPRFVQSGSLDLPPEAGGVQLSASGNAVLYWGLAPDSNWALIRKDLSTGESAPVPLGGYDSVLNGVLSPDGNRVAVFLQNAASGYYGDLWIFDVTTGAMSPVEASTSVAMSPSWSADSTKIAYGLRSASYPYPVTFEVLDLATGAARVVAGQVPYSENNDAIVSLSPAGNYLVYSGVNLTTPTLRLVNVATRSNLLLGAGYEPAWNAAETALSYTRPPDAADPEGLPSLIVQTLATALDRTIGDAEGGKFDPTGRSLLMRADSQLVLEDLASGRRQTVTSAETYTPDQYAWLADGRIAFRNYFENNFALFTPEDGHFTVPRVNLSVGPNLITATAVEPTSGLESEESLPISVTVIPGFFPDLSSDPADTVVYPSVPKVGQPGVASALVRNKGDYAVESVDVLLTLRSLGGQAVSEQRLILPAMEPGTSARVSLPFTAATAGRYAFTAIVDDQNVLFEADEGNNLAITDIEVVSADAPLSLTLTLGSPSYAENTRALISVALTNGGAAVSGTLTTQIESVVDGVVVVLLDSRPAALAVGGGVALPLTWQVGHTYAGQYRVRSTFVGPGGSLLAEAIQPITVLPSTSAAARLVVERYSTPLGELVRFPATVDNTSQNAPLQGALVRFTIRSSAGSVVLQTEASLALLLPGAQWPQTFIWSPAMPSGQFEARLEVIRESAMLASSAVPFVVVPSGAGLSGRLTLESDHLLEQQEGLADATLTNAATEPRPGTEARVEVRAAATAQILESLPFTVDLPANGSALRPTTLGGRPAGRYVVTLVDGATGRVVDRANLRVHAVIVPPSIHAPANGSRVATSHPDLSVNNAFVSDGSPLSYEFQIFAEPSLTVALPGGLGIAEGSGQTAWRVISRLVEDHTYYWRARATDSFSTSAWTEVASFTVDELNLPPFAPVPEQPDPGSRVATREPSLVVRNALDPEGDALIYEFQLATDASVQTVIASASAIAETPLVTSWRSPITLTEGATYYWRARATDGTSDSPWSETASFTVDSTNESPGAPTIISPVSSSIVTRLVEPLVAGLAADPENDPLVYRFQIDTTPTFDSPALQLSSDVAPGTASVSWTPASALSDDTTYFWRVAARDAATQGPWAQATFRVNLANDPPTAPVPLAPADGEIVTTNQPTLRVRNATDPDGDVLTYEFIVRDAAQNVVAAVTDVASGLVDTSVLTPVALAENGAFTWQARARDAEVAGPWSVPSSFRVNRVQDPPTAPTPFSPAGGVQTDNARPTLVVDNAMSPEGLPLSYSFELYRVTGATSTLVTAATGVTEGQPRTSWAVNQDLEDGSYSWRARANDGVQDGPWSPSALFSVLIDAPPLAPTGLGALGGDSRITLTWNRNAEPDVVGYRLYRSLTSGGPYTLVATVTDPGHLDVPLPNNVTQYYVVTAFDSRFESPRSTQASATPQSLGLTAQVSGSPTIASAECLINSSHHAGAGHPDGDGCCPTWVTVRIELSAGVAPSTISRASVRLAGSISADPSYDRTVDTDHDGIYEREFRFAFSSLAPLLQIGANTLSVSGTSLGTPFQGSFILTVQPLSVTMKFVPVTFNKRSQGQQVQTMLAFSNGILAEDVLFSSVRLNGVLPAERVVTSHQEKITFKFNRDATANLLPTGANVLVQVSGTIHGLPFTARDFIRVIQ